MIRKAAVFVAKYRRRRLLLAVLAGGFALWVACGPSAPFASNDPPPAFAIYFLLQSQTGLYYPAAAGTGAFLSGSHIVDIVGTPFVPLGGTYSFTPLWQDFRTYRTIGGGRWPAQWDINSVGGCGAGTTTRVFIQTKLPTVYCVPHVRAMNVTPDVYSTGAPPNVLTIYIYDTPPGTPTDVYIVDAYGSIYESTSAYVDSYGQVYFYNPQTPPGQYTVAADLYTLPGGYAAAQGNLQVWY